MSVIGMKRFNDDLIVASDKWRSYWQGHGKLVATKVIELVDLSKRPQLRGIILCCGEAIGNTILRTDEKILEIFDDELCPYSAGRRIWKVLKETLCPESSESETNVGVDLLVAGRFGTISVQGDGAISVLDCISDSVWIGSGAEFCMGSMDMAEAYIDEGSISAEWYLVKMQHCIKLAEKRHTYVREARAEIYRGFFSDLEREDRAKGRREYYRQPES